MYSVYRIFVLALLISVLLPVASMAQQKSDSTDQEISLGSGGRSSGGLSSLVEQGNYPLTIGGYAVGNINYDARTHANSFEASKAAVSFFKQTNQYIWFFTQLTATLAAPTNPGGSPETDLEIDDFVMNFVPPGMSDVSLSFGRFDVPIGFERDDEVLDLQATNSFNFQYARPSKMTGVVGRWDIDPSFGLVAYLSNGWNSPLSLGAGKTGGIQLGYLPRENINLEVNGIYGSQLDQGRNANRFLLNFSYTWQPTQEWIIGGEVNYGGQHAAPSFIPLSGHWFGTDLTLFRQFGNHFGLAVRGDDFTDYNGLRTGQAQTLQGLTITPLYFLGTGQEGIFANIETTTFRIPRFQIRAEMSLLHSSEPFFPDGATNVKWSTQYTIQLVTVF